MRLKIWCKGHLNCVVFKKPCIITIPQVLFNWSYFQHLWLLFFQFFCKDAFSFQTPIDCLTEPVLQDWAVPEYCWNCLNILPLCNFRMERHNQNLRFNLKIYLLPSLSTGLLQLYFSTNILLARFLTGSSLMIIRDKNSVKYSNQHGYHCQSSRYNPPDGLLPRTQCRWQQG